ncbi:hypothetical protein Pcinc_012877 [Petrolisthes cinctipes]|uniref:RNA-directed DNA polymerase n=1 Tax=Petrolisthes cinctipes TaxID=88211 RepID=A0AAE1G3S7_PETCI|nr:hypothetical protein Pcinc_012877 [Petrolisthes cinctipes]
MKPFRDLLKKPQGKRVYWDEQLQTMFRQAKEVICRLAKDGLAFYDRSSPTNAMTDFSKEGIGFVFLQQYSMREPAGAPFCCRSGWLLALCGSQHLSTAEAGYASVEGEALAWCLRKACLFLLGCPNLVLVTDHCPLVKLLGHRALKDIVNPRLFTLKEKTLQYRFTIRYLPSKSNCAADFLSRYPTLRAALDTVNEDLATDMEVATVAATTAAFADNGCITLDEVSVKNATIDDPVYQLLVAKVLAGDWCPKRSWEVACLWQFYGVRNRLAVSEGLVTYTYEQGSVRLVVPEPLCQQVAVHFHSGHQGLDSMLRRARQSVYWPGMEGDLQHLRETCSACNAHAQSQASEPLIITPPPEYPFQCTVTDLFQLDSNNYLVYTDRLTGWMEVCHLPTSATSNKLKTHLRSFFSRWGAPEELATDGGTNLVSDEMVEFFKRWGVRIQLLDTDSFAVARLQYLNKPLRGVNKSPAQLATGRQLRDGVPTAQSNCRVDRHWRQTLRHREVTMAQSRGEVEDRQGPARTLEPLTPGTKVWVQNQTYGAWDRSGVIVEVRPHRQYMVRLDGSGRISLRNRRHLRVRKSSPSLAQAGAQPATPTPAPAPNLIPSPQRSQPPPTRPRRMTQRPRYLADYIVPSPP